MEADKKTTEETVRVVVVEDDRTGLDPETLSRAFLDHVQFSQGKHPDAATVHDRYMALALAVRDRLVQRWMKTSRACLEADPRRVYYLSAEFLLGRTLRNNLQAVGIYDDFRAVLAELGLDLTELLEQEPDAGLGNGGLGRLAACFLDSLATLGFPAHGYGIRYEFGIFEQRMENGWQVERPDEWLRFGNPWEIVRPEYTVTIGFYGHTEEFLGHHGHWRVRWVPGGKVIGVP